MLDVSLWASFGAGILSFLSPCILPLVPPYLSFIAGTSLEELREKPDAARMKSVMPRALAFVLGFGFVFVLLGASASALGQLVSDHLALLSRIAGVIIFALGLHMTGIFRFEWLMRQAKFEVSNRPAGLIGAFVVGLAFGFGWTPCVGPVLASILLMAGTRDSAGEGISLLAAYAAGIGIPFLIAAAFTGKFLNWSASFRKHLALVETIMGIALMATGALIFFGMMPAIGNWLLDNVPMLGKIG